MTTPRRSLSAKNIPRSLRINTLICLYLLADKLNPTPFAWGCIWAALVFLFLVFLFDFFTAKDVELP